MFVYLNIIHNVNLAFSAANFKEKKFLPGPGVHLGGSVGRAPAHKDGDPGLNLGPGENFLSLTLTTFIFPGHITCSVTWGLVYLKSKCHGRHQRILIPKPEIPSKTTVSYYK